MSRVGEYLRAFCMVQYVEFFEDFTKSREKVAALVALGMSCSGWDGKVVVVGGGRSVTDRQYQKGYMDS